MKNSFRIISVLLAAVMVLTILPFGAFAEPYQDVWDISIEEGDTGPTAVIVKYTGSGVSDVEVPSTVTYQGNVYAVTSINDNAFYGHKELTSVELPGRLQYIGTNAFFGCTSLQSITIPQGVAEIGNDAFSGCTALTAIEADEYNDCFDSEDGVLFTEGKTQLLYYPISKAGAYYTIPDEVEKIDPYAFEGNKNIQYLSANSSSTLSEIGLCAFQDSESLYSVDLDEATNLTTIGYQAFANCGSLNFAELPNDIYTIPHGLFYNCSYLQDFVLPDNTHTIEESAFAFVGGMSSITLGQSVSHIMPGAFNHFNIEEFIVDNDNTDYATDDNGVLYRSVSGNRTDTLLKYPCAKADESYTVPDSCTSVGDGAFSGAYSLTAITIPSNVTTFGEDVFEDCNETLTVKCPCDSAAATYCKNAGVKTSLSHAYNGDICRYCDKIRKAVELTAISNVSTGIQVKWNAIPGADGYMIYYDSEAAGSSLAKWHFVDSVEGDSVTSYRDTKRAAGKTYRYTVVAFKGNQTSPYNKTGLSIRYLKMPTAKLENKSTGELLVSWSAVAGATGYIVYRRESGDPTSQKKLGTTTASSWKDTTATNGQIYDYTVKAYYTANGSTSNSAYNWVTTVKLAAPAFKLSNTVNGIQIRITKVKGAKGYYIFRKEKGGSYSKIGSTTGDTYLDKAAKAGVTYYYAVRAYNGKYLSGYTGYPIMRMGNMSAVTAKNVSGGIQLSWTKSAYAKGYIIYRKGKNNEYKKIGTTSSCSYIDTNVSPGYRYSYSVRAYNGDSLSSSSGAQYLRLTNPTVTLAKSSSKNIKITIKKVTGATSYEIYRKTGSGSYKKIATTKGLTYTDKNLIRGKSYTYSVRAYNYTDAAGYKSYSAYTTKTIKR